jgi:septum formation protein
VIYLASRSPQRAELLRRAGVPFLAVPSRADEEAVAHAHPQVLALERARAKATGAELPAGADGVVVAADTVIALGSQMFGKPRDDADAARILRALQNTTHTVVTGHCCVRVRPGSPAGPVACGVALAKVTMRSMSEEDIRAYLATGEHRDRAGAYAIQESGDRFVIDLQGAWATVVGLNVETVARLHREVADGPLPQAARP